MSTWPVDGPSAASTTSAASSIEIVRRCTNMAATTTTEPTYARPIPGPPITRPLKTDVMAKEMPVTVPTKPLALSRRPSGTSSVTHVDSAIPRMLPATEPSSVAPTSTQSAG